MSDTTTPTLFATVVADPPWQPTLGGSWSATRDKARGQTEYSLMDLSEICQMKPPTPPQAHLYVWTLAQHIDWGYEVARAWGFEPVITWTWVKSGLGAGRFRCNTEHVVVARKGPRRGNPFGSGGRHQQATAGTAFSWPRGKHSEKPQGFFDLVENLSPGPYLEMFARSQRQGWSVHGYEVSDGVEIDPCEGGRSRTYRRMTRLEIHDEIAYGPDDDEFWIMEVTDE